MSNRKRNERLAAREAARLSAEAARARKTRRRARRERRAQLRRKLTPSLPRRGRVGLLFPRRTAGQRSALAAGYALVLFLIWYNVADLGVRVALTAVATIALPALAVLAFGRRSS